MMNENNKTNKTIKTIKTIDETLLIHMLEKGDKLYHYTSANGLLGICEGNFWITERGFLNDKMEFQVATDRFCEVIAKHISDSDLCNKIQESVRKEVNRSQNPSLDAEDKVVAYTGDYVISFSLDDDSPLMWSSYSDYFGYCIQFDFEKFMEAISSKSNHSLLHGKVVYDREQQVDCIEETIKRSYFDDFSEYGNLNKWDDFNNLSEEQLSRWIIHVSVEVSAYNMFFKLPCFKDEHEYRFVFMLGHDGSHYKPGSLWEQQFRVKDEVLIPYVSMPIDSINAIEKVLIGAKNTSDIALKGVRHLFRNHKHNVVVEKSNFPLRY